jgi:hypothetical protein
MNRAQRGESAGRCCPGSLGIGEKDGDR